VWPALVVLLCSAARGQAPAYSAAGVVNAANYAPGPFAPNSVVTIFGSNLCSYSLCSDSGATANEVAGGTLPTAQGLAGASVYVSNIAAPILFVSPTQINFLIPTNLLPGTAQVVVVKQGLNGGPVNISLVPGAPALFSAGGYAIAEDWNAANALVTPDAPAHSGDVVILYATGLGMARSISTGQVPAVAAQIDNLASLKVYLGGVALDTAHILYAGLTPGFAGLYQINMVLPNNLGSDPEVLVAIGDQSSPAGLKLAVR
jgi:uncharacterized protein (TIGR03437 family)